MLAEAELDALVAEVIPDPERATAMVERECEWCGVRFLRRAPHGRFCSDSCRVRAFRRRNGEHYGSGDSPSGGS